jgi:hypothetical protein
VFVLAAGDCFGQGASGIHALVAAEVFDPASGEWRATAPLNHSRQADAASLLGDGRVLICGGSGPG